VERYRTEAFDFRSKYESLQEEYGGFVDSQAKDAEANQTLLKTTRDALQRQIADLHKQLDAYAVDDTPRQLERLKTQLDVSEKQWSDDNTRVSPWVCYTALTRLLLTFCVISCPVAPFRAADCQGEVARSYRSAQTRGWHSADAGRETGS
jgi:hypothetical protein